MPNAMSTVTSFVSTRVVIALAFVCSSSVAACAIGEVGEVNGVEEDAGSDARTDVATGFTPLRHDAGPVRDVLVTDSGRTAVVDARATPPYDAGIGSVYDSGPAPPVADAGAFDPYDSGPVTPVETGTYCQTCASASECGAGNLCLSSRSTGAAFCGRDCATSPCAADATCVSVSTGSGISRQCVPTSGSCPIGSGSTDAGTGTGGTDGLQRCVDGINMYRAMVGAPPLTRDATIETFAAEGAEADAMSGRPHGHFISTGGGGGLAYAENEIPGWPLAMFGTIGDIMDTGSADMWAEGPGGGHYDNMRNTRYTRVGCGVYTNSRGEVWVTQDYR